MEKSSVNRAARARPAVPPPIITKLYDLDTISWIESSVEDTMVNSELESFGKKVPQNKKEPNMCENSH